MACKPVSLPGFDTGRWPFLWDVRRRTPHATYPDGNAETRKVPSLFGLAPGGACRAVLVAEAAVRSYRTISTLPGLAPLGVLIAVPLSLESLPPDIIRHRVSVEPGLSSRLRATRLGAASPSRSLPRRSPQGEDGRPSGHLTPFED